MERLRYVARASGIGQEMLVQEAASALAPVIGDSAELVMACRRLVSSHPSAGALWWLCSRVLTSVEPGREAWNLADQIAADKTIRELAFAIPDGSTIAVLGWPDIVSRALPSRGDIETLVIDAAHEGSGLVRQLTRAEVPAYDVPFGGLSAAVAESDLVVLEAEMVGPESALVVSGSRAAAAVAKHAGIPVWLVSGLGRVMPSRIWDVASERVLSEVDPWDADYEILPLDLVDTAVNRLGPGTIPNLIRRPETPLAPELLKEGIAL